MKVESFKLRMMLRQNEFRPRHLHRTLPHMRLRRQARMLADQNVGQPRVLEGLKPGQPPPAYPRRPDRLLPHFHEVHVFIIVPANPKVKKIVVDFPKRPS